MGFKEPIAQSAGIFLVRSTKFNPLAKRFKNSVSSDMRSLSNLVETGKSPLVLLFERFWITFCTWCVVSGSVSAWSLSHKGEGSTEAWVLVGILDCDLKSSYSIRRLNTSLVDKSWSLFCEKPMSFQYFCGFLHRFCRLVRHRAFDSAFRKALNACRKHFRFSRKSFRAWAYSSCPGFKEM